MIHQAWELNIDDMYLWLWHTYLKNQRQPNGWNSSILMLAITWLSLWLTPRPKFIINNQEENNRHQNWKVTTEVPLWTLIKRLYVVWSLSPVSWQTRSKVIFGKWKFPNFENTCAENWEGNGIIDTEENLIIMKWSISSLVHWQSRFLPMNNVECDE